MVAAKCFSVRAKQHRSLKLRKFLRYSRISFGRAARLEDVVHGAFSIICR